MTITWEYDPNTTILSIEEYEKARPSSVRRTQSQMILPRSVRVGMLRKEWGVSNQDIVEAVRLGVRTKNQRRTTLGNLGRTEKVEELIEGATKQLLKTLFLRKGSSKKAYELEKEIQRVDDQRAQVVLEQTMEGDYDESETPYHWGSELMHDELESENGYSQGFCQDNGIEEALPRDDDFEEISIGKDNKAPEKIDPKEFQAAGESASQGRASHVKKNQPVITAVEPDDDILEVNSRASITTDC